MNKGFEVETFRAVWVLPDCANTQEGHEEALDCSSNCSLVKGAFSEVLNTVFFWFCLICSNLVALVLLLLCLFPFVPNDVPHVTSNNFLRYVSVHCNNHTKDIFVICMYSIGMISVVL